MITSNGIILEKRAGFERKTFRFENRLFERNCVAAVNFPELCRCKFPQQFENFPIFPSLFISRYFFGIRIRRPIPPPDLPASLQVLACSLALPSFACVTSGSVSQLKPGHIMPLNKSNAGGGARYLDAVWYYLSKEERKKEVTTNMCSLKKSAT